MGYVNKNRFGLKWPFLKKINGLIITPLVYSGLVAKAIVDGPETPCIRR